MEDVFGVLLHRDMWRRAGDGVWPLRNVADSPTGVERRRLLAGSPRLYEQETWEPHLLAFVSLTAASGSRHNGYLCRLVRSAT